MPLSTTQARIWAHGSCEPTHPPADRIKDGDGYIETLEDGTRWRLAPTGRKYRGHGSTTTEFKCVEQLATIPREPTSPKTAKTAKTKTKTKTKTAKLAN